MPTQQRVWRRDRGDLAQGPTAHPVRPCRQPSAIVVGETQSPGPQLAPQEPVLFDQVRDHLPFRRASQSVTTVSSRWKAEASITGRSLYHVTGWKTSETSAEKWNTTGDRNATEGEHASVNGRAFAYEKSAVDTFTADS